MYVCNIDAMTIRVLVSVSWLTVPSRKTLLSTVLHGQWTLIQTSPSFVSLDLDQRISKSSMWLQESWFG